MPRGVSLSRAVRALFEEMGELSTYDAYKILCVERGMCRNMMSVYNVFHALRDLCLIRVVDTEPGPGSTLKKIYEMTPGLENHPCWDAPLCCRYGGARCTPRQKKELVDSGIASQLKKLCERMRQKMGH